MFLHTIRMDAVEENIFFTVFFSSVKPSFLWILFIRSSTYLNEKIHIIIAIVGYLDFSQFFVTKDRQKGKKIFTGYVLFNWIINSMELSIYP